jgi:multidrug efflux pump subunit AcrB
MKLRSVSPTDIENAIKSSNIRVTAGKIRTGEYIREIEVNGTFLDKEKAENIFISEHIKLSDVAKIEDSFSEKVSYVEVGKGKKMEDVIFLSIAKRKGENAVQLAKNIHEELKIELAKPKYENLDYKVYRDDGKVAEKAVNGLGSNLLQSIAIVFLVLLIFLGFQSASLVALAIPLSLALVFVAGLSAGQTINRITLFALILSLGLLVDSATVVVENISRHVHNGIPKKKAIPLAVNEVGIGLFLSTVTSVIVFLPTSQISGMMGAYMGPLSFFVPMALIMSLLVAYILTPFIADLILPDKSSSEKSNPKKNGYLLKVQSKFKQIKNKVIKKYKALIYKENEDKKSKNEIKNKEKTDFFDKLSNRYSTILEYLLKNKKRQKKFLIISFSLLLIVFTFPVLKLVHFRMLPGADKAQYYIYLDAKEGTDLEKMYRMTNKVIEIASTNEETTSIQNFVGEPPVVDFNGMYKGSHLREGFNLATLRINLTKPEERRIKSGKIVQEMRKKINDDKEIKKYVDNGLAIKFIEDPPGPPVQATLVAKVKGSDREIREKIAEKIKNKFTKTDRVVDIDTSIEGAYFRTIYKIDHRKAFLSAISTAQISNTLYKALNGVNVSEYHIPNHNEISYIELQFDKQNRNSIQDLSSIYIKNQTGEMVPLSSLVQKTESRNIPTNYNDERISTTYVTAEMENRSVVYAVIDLMFDIIGDKKLSLENNQDNIEINGESPIHLDLSSWNLFEINFKDSSGAVYKIDWGGEWEMTVENFRDLGIAMIVAFVLIYAVLVAQFRSFSAPGLIMTTIPLGFLGIMPGFAILDAINDTFLTATSLIGFIALMGIVVNNAILYLEYYTQMLNEGHHVHKALIEAGKTRLRPILLTSTTTVLGSLTIASDPVWSGLAWSIVFGLSLSSLFTLGVFPVLLNLVRPGLK